MKRFLKNVTYVFVVVFAVVLLFSGKVNAKEKEEIIAKCTVNGVERYLVRYEDNSFYFRIEGQEDFCVCACISGRTPEAVGFDKLGTVYYKHKEKEGLYFWSYDYAHYFNYVRYNNYYLDDFKKFKFDSDGIIIGIVTKSGDVFPTLSVKEMERIQDHELFTLVEGEDNYKNLPKKARLGKKLTVKKKGSYTCLYEDNKLIMKIKVKNGKLTYQVGKRKKVVVKGVTYVNYTLTRKILFFKNGKAYTVNKKGKKAFFKNTTKFIGLCWDFATEVDGKKL